MSGQIELDLFGADPVPLPEGMRYQPSFLDALQERELLDRIATLPFEHMDYKGYQALRRVVSYGGSYDFSAGRLDAAPPIPEWLHPLRAQAAAWAGLPSPDLAQALVAEYRPGTPLGWHRDVPDFEDILGVSLLGEGVMRFRPWPLDRGRARADLRLRLAPRSIYLLRGPGRWAWQHSVMPTGSLRYSITFRTPRR